MHGNVGREADGIGDAPTVDVERCQAVAIDTGCGTVRLGAGRPDRVVDTPCGDASRQIVVWPHRALACARLACSWPGLRVPIGRQDTGHGD